MHVLVFALALLASLTRQHEQNARCRELCFVCKAVHAVAPARVDEVVTGLYAGGGFRS